MSGSTLPSETRIGGALAGRISASVEESDGHRPRCISGAGQIDHVGKFGADLDAPHAGMVLVANDCDKHVAASVQVVAAPCQFRAGEDVAAKARDSRGRRGIITCVAVVPL
jgi:hypothetical protein